MFDVKLREFDDFDLFREELSGWDTEPVQLSAGPLRLGLGTLNLGDVHVGRLSLNRLVADRMAIDAHVLMYVVCLAPKVFCGYDVPAGSLIVFGPGREYRSVLSEGWLSFEVVVSQHVSEAAGLPLATATERSLAPELSVIPLSNGLTAQFQKWARDLFDPALLDMPVRYRQLWADAAREITLRLLAAASAGPHGPSHEGVLTKRLPFRDLVLAALEHIDRNGTEPLTIRKTAKTLGVSERALQSGFRKMLGVSPSQYILALRLQNARRDLLAVKDRGAKVTTIAFDHDFNHLSRFAQHYRRLFGESPSQTLRAAGTRIDPCPKVGLQGSEFG